MAIRPILNSAIETENKTLTTPCTKVKFPLTKEDTQLITDLIETVKAATDPEGAGLAAPQIGVTTKICIARRFFANPENHEETLSKEYVLINPKIITSSETTNIHFEGCLSIPDIYGQVERPTKIKIKYTNEEGIEMRKKFDGFMARVVQHEIDHLNGVLFTSKVIGQTISEQDMDNLINENGDDL